MGGQKVNGRAPSAQRISASLLEVDRASQVWDGSCENGRYHHLKLPLEDTGFKRSND